MNSLKKWISNLIENNYFLLIIRDECIAIKELFIEHKFIFTALTIVFLGGLYFIDPIPGKTIRLAVVGEDSGYALFAKKIEAYLGEQGIKLSVQYTESSIQNATALANSEDGVNTAFIQGGVISPELAQKFQSLGSVDSEPVWIFYRKRVGNQIDRLKDLSEFRVGVGPYRSGTWTIASKLFALNGVDIQTDPHFKADSYENNVADLLSGKLDAVINVNSAMDPIVQRLLNEKSIDLFELSHAAAYDIHLPFVTVVNLPAGAIDIDKQIPPHDIPMLTTSTNLAVSKNMHPGLQVMLLMAVKDAQRGRRRLFSTHRQNFPAYIDSSIPISPAASNFYDYGVPQAMRYLPFWLAGIVDRIWVYILALIAIVIPLKQLNVNLRTIRFELRTERIQRELLSYEREMLYGNLDSERRSKLLSRLDELISRESKFKVPSGCESSYLSFLRLLTAMREKLLIDDEDSSV